MTTPKDNALHLMEGQGGAASGDVKAEWPTKEMISVGMQRMFNEKRYNAPWDDVVALMFLDMLKAAPSAPLEGSEGFPSGVEYLAQTNRAETRDWLRGWNECRATVAPKTAHAHWVDEVEASGEAEKHAADAPFGWWHQGETEEESGFFKAGDFGNVACPTCTLLYARPADSEAEKFKALYEKSQELFAREREITKELAEALMLVMPLAKGYAAHHPVRINKECIEAGVAALSKVQHVAARGAEVSE